jgi:hypothetical protein
MDITKEVKYRTRMATDRLIARGILQPRPSCELCGTSGQMFVHHVDYTNPLDVLWLCRACHVDIHRKCGTLGRPKTGRARHINLRVDDELLETLKAYASEEIPLSEVIRIAVMQSIVVRRESKRNSIR